jgi:general secretion pathway protein G
MGGLFIAWRDWFNPDAAANKLFVEALQLMKAAQEAELTSYAEAFKLSQAALFNLEKITTQYSSSQLAVQLTSGQTKIGPYIFTQFQEYVHESARRRARAEIELFGVALDTFRLDVGRYPTSQEGLAALRTRPFGLDRWDGPYLKEEIPRDPWGNPYVYRSPGQRESYELLSYGADGTAGGAGDNADIKSWEG